MSDRRRLLGNMMALFTLQGANYVLPLITLPYLVRVLGPEKFGLIAFAQAFIQYFVVLTEYGFNFSATRDVAIHRDDPHKLGEIVSAVMCIKLIFSLGGMIVLGVLLLVIPTLHRYWAPLGILYLTVLGSALFPLWLFQGLERMKDITWMNISTRLITTAAIFMWIRNPSDYLLAAGIQAAPLIFAAIPAWLILRKTRTFLWKKPERTDLIEQLESGLHLFLSSIGVNIYTASNTLVLGLISGPIAVGYFSAAYRIIRALIGLLTPITQTLYPHVSILTQQSKERAMAFIATVMRPTAFVSLLFSFLIYLFAAPIVHLALGAQYDQSISILRIFSPLLVFVPISTIFGTLTMLPFGMAKAFSRVLLLAALVNIVLVIPLARSYGGRGAAISMLCTEIYVTVAMYVLLRSERIHLFHLSNGLSEK